MVEINWKEETYKRKDAVKKIDREISLLHKNKRQIGSTRALEIIRESIEVTLGLPAKIVNSRTPGYPHNLVVFVKDTTPKQIRHRRLEKQKFSIEVYESADGYNVQYINKDGNFVNMPEDIDEIIKIMEGM